MRILIGIPAFNEAQMVGKVVDSFPKKIDGENIDILVVDDGSQDKTANIAKSKGVRVVSHILNRGLGGALKTIFAYAREKRYDILVTFDADGQHDVCDLVKIISPLLKKKAEVVIGTRWKNIKNAPVARLLINQVANIITFLLFAIWTSDSQSGLRAFGKRAISVINLQTDGMEVSSEFFREIYINKLKFVEVPIHVIYTHYSQSKGQKLSNAINILFQLLFRLLR